MVAAFRRGTRPWRSIFSTRPVGWGRSTRKKLHQIVQDTDSYVQSLNDRFTNPSGNQTAAAQAPAETQQPTPVKEEAET